MINDQHFFKNTHQSVVRCNLSNTTNPHKDQDLQIKSKLLIILKAGKSSIFIYETYTIVTSRDKIVDVKPNTHRKEKSNEKIIENQLQHYKESKLNLGSEIEILAYNPNEYTKEELISQTI